MNSPDPLLKVPAIQTAVADRNRANVAQMVADLDSDDSAIRFYSIQGLQRLTGDDFGYCFYADDSHREPAVQRWKSWLSKQKFDESSGEAADKLGSVTPRANPGGWTTGG